MNAENLSSSYQYERPAQNAKRNGPFRSFIVWSLIVLAGICTLLGTLAVWVNTSALNTNNFVNAVAPLVQNDAVARAVSIKAVDIMWDAYNMDEVIQESVSFLPEEYQFVGEPASTGMETAAQMTGEEILKSSQFQSVWKAMLTETHSTGLRALEGEGPVEITEKGEAVLDLGELIDEIKDELVKMGLSSLEDADVSGAGKVVVFKSGQLGLARNSVAAVKVLSWLLPVLALSLFIAAILISYDDRKALLGSGIALILAMSVVLLSLWIAKLVTLSQLSIVNRDAVSVVWNQLESGLKTVDVSLLIFGVVVVIVCLIAGPSGWAVRLRGFFKPRKA